MSKRQLGRTRSSTGKRCIEFHTPGKRSRKSFGHIKPQHASADNKSCKTKRNKGQLRKAQQTLAVLTNRAFGTILILSTTIILKYALWGIITEEQEIYNNYVLIRQKAMKNILEKFQQGWESTTGVAA